MQPLLNTRQITQQFFSAFGIHIVDNPLAQHSVRLFWSGYPRGPVRRCDFGSAEWRNALGMHYQKLEAKHSKHHISQRNCGNFSSPAIGVREESGEKRRVCLRLWRHYLWRSSLRCGNKHRGSLSSRVSTCEKKMVRDHRSDTSHRKRFPLKWRSPDDLSSRTVEAVSFFFVPRLKLRKWDGSVSWKGQIPFQRQTLRVGILLSSNVHVWVKTVEPRPSGSDFACMLDLNPLLKTERIEQHVFKMFRQTCAVNLLDKKNAFWVLF